MKRYSKLVGENLHLLMPKHAIPSIRLSIDKELIGKPVYRCCDPTLPLFNRLLQNGSAITLLHHSIKERQDIEVAQITIDINQSEYDLGGAKVYLVPEVS